MIIILCKSEICNKTECRSYHVMCWSSCLKGNQSNNLVNFCTDTITSTFTHTFDTHLQYSASSSQEHVQCTLSLKQVATPLLSIKGLSASIRPMNLVLSMFWMSVSCDLTHPHGTHQQLIGAAAHACVHAIYILKQVLKPLLQWVQLFSIIKINDNCFFSSTKIFCSTFSNFNVSTLQISSIDVELNTDHSTSKKHAKQTLPDVFHHETPFRSQCNWIDLF
jgi:hypothetical protein